MDGHEALAALIPWYVNGTLDERDMTRLSAHVDTCAACRRDVEATLAWARALHEPGHAVVAGALDGSDANFARLLRRLPRSKRPLSVRQRRRVLAACAAAVLVAAGTWLWRAATPVDVSYVAMTTTPAASGTVFQVIFEPATTEQEVRALLLDSGGELVASPSTHGVYRISVGGIADAEAYAARLRRHPAVRWAEVERR